MFVFSTSKFLFYKSVKCDQFCPFCNILSRWQLYEPALAIFTALGEFYIADNGQLLNKYSIRPIILATIIYMGSSHYNHETGVTGSTIFRVTEWLAVWSPPTPKLSSARPLPWSTYSFRWAPKCGTLTSTVRIHKVLHDKYWFFSKIWIPGLPGNFGS